MGPSARIHLPARGCERQLGSTNDKTGGMRRLADSSHRGSRRRRGMWTGLYVPLLLHQRLRLWRKEVTLHNKVILPEAQVATTPLGCNRKGCVFHGLAGGTMPTSRRNRDRLSGPTLFSVTILVPIRLHICNLDCSLNGGVPVSAERTRIIHRCHRHLRARRNHSYRRNLTR
jgi:hypothetical protein